MFKKIFMNHIREVTSLYNSSASINARPSPLWTVVLTLALLRCQSVIWLSIKWSGANNDVVVVVDVEDKNRFTSEQRNRISKNSGNVESNESKWLSLKPKVTPLRPGSGIFELIAASVVNAGKGLVRSLKLCNTIKVQPALGTRKGRSDQNRSLSFFELFWSSDLANKKLLSLKTTQLNISFLHSIPLST